MIDEAYVRTRAFLQNGGIDARGQVESGIHYMLPQRRRDLMTIAQ